MRFVCQSVPQGITINGAPPRALNVSQPALLDDELHPLLRERRDQRALPRWYRRGAYDEFGVLSTILMGNANLL